MQEPQKPNHVFAFWPYDKFPYVLGAVGHQVEPNVMLLEGYGRWSTREMFAYQPVEMGRETQLNLKTLEKEYRAELEALLKNYMAKALQIMPALAMTHAYKALS